MRRRNKIGGESLKEGNLSLDGTLHTLLDNLECDVRSSGETFGDFSFRRILRSVCVMKKQDRVPFEFGWRFVGDGRRVGGQVCKADGRAGLAELQYEKGCGGLRVHDLTHDFAMQEAEKK